MNQNTQNTQKNEVIQRLSDLEVQEVSLVDNGANRKRWVFVKCAGGISETQALVDRYYAAKQGDEDALIQILRELLQQLSPEVLAKLGLQRLEPPAEEPPAENPQAEEMRASQDVVVEARAKSALEAMAQTVRALEERLQKTQEELVKTKLALGKTDEPQSGREPRGSEAVPVETVRVLGMKPLNK